MKTVSTKLDNSDHTRLLDMCNDEGQCVSESLRDIIKQHLDAHDEYLEVKKEEKREKPKPQIVVMDVK